jgi:hypothetical protein
MQTKYEWGTESLQNKLGLCVDVLKIFIGTELACYPPTCRSQLYSNC